jgi:allantoate deiminase
VEQGPVLAAKGTELGLVDCIVGIQRYMVTVKGRADHAGTTPMDMRADAMEMASGAIFGLPAWAREYEDGTVATVGYISAKPGGINIVAEEVQFSVDIRSRNSRHIDEIAQKLKEALEHAAENCGGSYEMEQKLKIRPLHLSEELLAVMERACKDRGYSYQRMPSGAGHDTLKIGQTIPSVMVFVPSKDGRSHCPVEWSEYVDLAKAAVLGADLIETLIREEEA